MRTGRVETAWFDRHGTKVAVAAPEGTQVISVLFSGDFDEDGGQLQHVETETVYDYTSADPDAETITLATPLPTGVSFDEGDVLRVYPLTDDLYAHVRLDDAEADEEPLTARVSQPIRAMLPEGIRDPGTGEVVATENIGLEWVVRDVLGSEPVIDGGYLDPTTIPPAKDGIPPGESPTPTVQGGIGTLFVKWVGVANQDPVTYEVHLSVTTGFTPSGSTLAVETSGTLVALRKLPDGTDLAYDTTYYVKLVAKDPDGDAEPSVEASGQLVRVNTPDIAAEYVYAGNILVDQLTGGTLNAEMILGALIRTAAAGARVEIGPSGITLYGPDESPSIVLPSDTEATAKYRGDVEAGGLTVTGNAAFRSTGNEISKGADLVLQTATTAPQSAPTTARGWDSVPGDGLGFDFGLVWADGRWNAVSDTEIPAVSRQGTTDLPLGDANSPRPWGGLTRIGSSWYTVGFVYSNGYDWYITKYDASTGAQQAQALVVINNRPGPSSSERPAIGTDGTNVLTAEFRESDKRFKIRRWSASTLAFLDVLDTSVGNAFNGPVVGVRRGAFDLGSTHTVILSQNDGFYRPFDSSGNYVISNAFESPAPGSMTGFDWDGTRFWATDVGEVGHTGAKIYKHTTHKLTGTGATYHVTSTWRNSVGGYETTMGAVGSFTMKSRAQVMLTTPTIPGTGNPDDPDSVAVYLSNTTKNRTALWRQTLPAVGENSVTLGDDIVFSGSNPPSTNNFPGATPGQITNADGTLVISGDGTLQIASMVGDTDWITLTANGAWLNDATNPVSAKVHNGWVSVYGSVQRINFNYLAGGNEVVFDLPVEIPPVVRDYAVRCNVSNGAYATAFFKNDATIVIHNKDQINQNNFVTVSASWPVG